MKNYLMPSMTKAPRSLSIPDFFTYIYLLSGPVHLFTHVIKPSSLVFTCNQALFHCMQSLANNFFILQSLSFMQKHLPYVQIFLLGSMCNVKKCKHRLLCQMEESMVGMCIGQSLDPTRAYLRCMKCLLQI